MRIRTGQNGGSLTELMVATMILSIGVLGMFGAFRFIARTTLISRGTSLATNLGQERIESLKNLSYYALQITTASATDATVSPSILYDTSNYPPETIAIGGITYTRYTYVGMAEITGSDIVDVAFTYPDTGLKQITVHTVWTQEGRKKVWTLRNLLENPNINPLDATISGTVSNSAGGTVGSALVVVEQNEDWNATTNNAGYYSFSVYHGTYTVRASSNGFSDTVSSKVVVARGGAANVPLTLTAVATGTIAGNLWINTDLVISQVVAVTNTMVGDGNFYDVEYVELFNPTTFPINIGTTNQAAPKPYSLLIGNRDNGSTYEYHVDNGPEPGSWPFYMINVSSYVQPGRYYLIANASYFYLAGQWSRADAFYTDTLANQAAQVPGYPNYIKNDQTCSVLLYSYGTAVWHDYVGWKNSSGLNPPWVEGTVIPNAGGSDGLGSPAGKQIVRVSSPGISAAMLNNYGRAYDSNDNSQDFLYEGTYFNSFTSFVTPKSSASGVFTTLTGKVPTSLGTVYVSASDTNSGSTIAYTAYVTSGALSLPYSKFILGGVSTGTWTVSAGYSPYFAFIDTVVVSQGLYIGVPNAATTPAWVGSGLSHVQMTSTSLSGFVKGTITTTSGAGITGITVIGGGSSKITGSNGVYFMPVSSGTISVTANPNNGNASYAQGIETVAITAGAVATQNFVLSLAGRITGYVTTGTTPLAYQAIAVTLTGGGSQVGSGVTDTGGNFTIRNVSTGTYTVFPVLESGQDVSPNSLPAVLTTTGSVNVGTFTVAGAFGSISGTVSDVSGLITSGALIIASTSSIASSPAAIVASSAPAQTPIYMVSSKADGTYLLPVRGSATYYLSAYVPVISGAASVTVTTKTYSNIIVAPSATTTKNVAIP